MLRLVFAYIGDCEGKMAAIAAIRLVCCALSVVFTIWLASWRCVCAWVVVRSLIDLLRGDFFRTTAWGFCGIIKNGTESAYGWSDVEVGCVDRV